MEPAEGPGLRALGQGKLTDNDLAQIKGDGEVLKGKLQEYYGRSREQAEKDVQEWLDAERASAREQKV